MAIDDLGDWVDFGSKTLPRLQVGIWIGIDGLNELPSNIVRVRFGAFSKVKVQNFLRIRAVVFSDTQILHTPSSVIWPNPNEEKLVRLSIPEETLRVDGWGVGFEIMKCYRFRRKQATTDLVDYDVTFQSLKQTLEQRTGAITADLNRIERKIDVLVN